MISLYSYLTSTFQKCHRRNYLCKYRSSNYRSSIQPLQIVGRALSLQIAKHHKMIFRCTDIIFFFHIQKKCACGMTQKRFWWVKSEAKYLMQWTEIRVWTTAGDLPGWDNSKNYFIALLS